MKYDISSGTVTLKTGRTFHAEDDIFAPLDGGFLYACFAGDYEGADMRDWTADERAEIADYMIQRWAEWSGRSIIFMTAAAEPTEQRPIFTGSPVEDNRTFGEIVQSIYKS